MSHFTVLVIGDNPEEQLAPFQENNNGDCPQEYMEFHDVEDEYKKKYKTESVVKVFMPDGRMLNRFDDELKVGDLFDRKTVIPKGAKEKKMKFTKLYKTFEEYMADWCGFKARDPEKKRYGYWENPQRKWDWYSLGGRWTGFFKLREGVRGAVGSPGLMTEPAAPGYADQSYKRDIDLQAMRDEAADEAGTRYDKLARLLGGSVPEIAISWESLAKKKMSIEAKRKKYNEQPALKAVEEARKRVNLNDDDKQFLTWLELDKYQGGRDAYVGRAIRDAFSTFAVLKDGKWYENGEMGWWGCVGNEKDGAEWATEFCKLLESVSDDTLLSVFDCHI